MPRKKRTIGFERRAEWVSTHAWNSGNPFLRNIWIRGNSSWSRTATIGSRLYNESKSKTVGIRRAAAMASIAAERHSGEEDGRVCTDKSRYSYAESLHNGGAKCRGMTKILRKSTHAFPACVSASMIVFRNWPLSSTETCHSESHRSTSDFVSASASSSWLAAAARRRVVYIGSRNAEDRGAALNRLDNLNQDRLGILCKTITGRLTCDISPMGFWRVKMR